MHFLEVSSSVPTLARLSPAMDDEQGLGGNYGKLWKVITNPFSSAVFAGRGRARLMEFQ